jgi:hypothetical protein
MAVRKGERICNERPQFVEHRFNRFQFAAVDAPGRAPQAVKDRGLGHNDPLEDFLRIRFKQSLFARFLPFPKF